MILFLMKFNNSNSDDKTNFYSDEMFVSKKFLTENHLKLTYQRQLISNLDSKHKYWSQFIGKQ